MCRILKWDFNHRTNQQHTEHILKIVSVFLDILRSLSLRETIPSKSQSKQFELSRQPVYFKLESWSLKPFTSSSEGHLPFLSQPSPGETIPFKLCSLYNDMCFNSLGISLLGWCLCLLVEWEFNWLWKTLDWSCKAKFLIPWITVFFVSLRYLTWWFHFSYDHFSFNWRLIRQQASFCQLRNF